MARALRLEVPGGIHHVWDRGNNKEPIFLSPGDEERFLTRLDEMRERFGWVVLGYCLMGNHYHLAIRTPRPNLRAGMRDLNSAFAQRVNRRSGRCGPLFQGRYKAKLVERGDYLLHLLRYIARNPVVAELCRRPEEWRLSSTPAVLGLAPPGVVAVDEVLPLFGMVPQAARANFRAFVNDPVRDGDDKWLERPLLGSDEFIRRHLDGAEASEEVPRAGLLPRAARPSLAEVVTRPLDDAQIARAVLELDYTMVEVARALGCHPRTIKRRLTRWQSQPGSGLDILVGKEAA